MVHQTPARSVELSPLRTPADSPPAAQTSTPTPVLNYEELPATISADGLMIGMGKNATPATRLHVYRGNTLSEIRDAHSLSVDALECKAGQVADLAALRKALPTRRESQKSERDGAVRHSFPQPGVEVQIWIKDGHYQRFALLKAP